MRKGYPARLFNHSCNPNVYLYTGCKVQVGDDPVYLDALLKGYPARFLDHSCSPNVYLCTVIAEFHGEGTKPAEAQERIAACRDTTRELEREMQ
ncbi:hypothetical protein Esi_0076_0093 [Ectocarpus siliculosus]|uniref:SET domain-containing protein n=1 Tax=Ectocarpus siliculosus TaxID=2880 RepID=D8LST2_ECTSI|nr:hypothetical protein Esi_0076_0093 [Ectocarpus siliculosus]|eukprot:CBN75282.1 hypothetical protein Esi_0076_0093 [Ectocarpus siliculosus]